MIEQQQRKMVVVVVVTRGSETDKVFSCCGCPSAVAAFPRSRPHPRRVDGSLEMLLRQQPRHSAVTTRRVLLLLHYSSKLTH